MPTFPQLSGTKPGPGGALVKFNVAAATQVVSGYGTVMRVFVNTAPSVAGGVYDVDTGTTATAKATTNATGVVTGVTVMTSGGGYSSAPTVTIAAPTSGTTATATATIDSNGHVTAITVTNSGSGYTSVPAVTLSASTAGGTVGAANLICAIPTTAGPLVIEAPYYSGLYIDPGTSGVVSVTYGL